MNENRPPGPWRIRKMSRSQIRPYFVARDVSCMESFTHFEQLQHPDGGCATFDTEQEAADALAAYEQRTRSMA